MLHEPENAFICAARHCPRIKQVRGTQLSTLHHHYMTVVVMTCEAGFTFKFGGVSRTLICQENGRWHAPVPQCIGNNMLMYAI